jgi:hypothetical protein
MPGCGIRYLASVILHQAHVGVQVRTCCARARETVCVYVCVRVFAPAQLALSALALVLAHGLL